ncbi:MGMT family protein [Parahaliea maris]|uniref:MGMT family protein n=1 Tax=Parahaliea maris TaxID=2716870 RepID=A0A5C8ZVQ3_9GAMM|nr:MGMT family protein [Parahaliea maris]TXS91341.1 MGMT family protein [Parahaliea maris]
MTHPETSINERIWQVVAMIPSGKVATYGDVALHAGLGRAARRVGLALRQLPAGSKVPWHRVINAQGSISLPAGSSGEYTQRQRLEAEGVRISQGKIALRKYRWTP